MLAVIGGLFANGLIAVLKLAAAFITGSSGMMAEALHSVADTTNQIFLLLGLRFYKRPASSKHPFGYGKERFFWSFIAAIFNFGVGATYAIHEGLSFRDYLRESKDPTAKTVLFEDSAALIVIMIAALGLKLTEYQVGGAAGAYWDGIA